jgi:Fe-S cluster assembly protein SufD
MDQVAQIVDWNKDLIDIYKRNVEVIKQDSPDFINRIRDRGIEQFKKLGLPGKRDENYKYFNLDTLYKHEFTDSLSAKEINFDVDHIFHCDIPTLDTHVILLLNGYYFDRKNPVTKLPSGAIVGSLIGAEREYPGVVEKHFGKYASMETEGLVALNTAFAKDGIFIYVPEGVRLKKPIQIVNLLLSKSNTRVNHRNLIVVEKNAEARVMICDHTLSEHRYFTNSVTEIMVDENAYLDYIKVQNEHNFATNISSLYAKQEKDSRLNTNIITLHGGLVRNNVNIVLNGEGCENNTSGLYLVDKGQHVDNYTFIDHAKPNCLSNQMYKGVLDDFATGAFNGRILVREDAQQTMAFQANNNILLTDDAKMNTKPQLEIYADDVKCSHGATVGQLDEDALFYLRARGIEEREARLMLMFAFAHEIITRLEVEPLQKRIDSLVDKRLRGELSRCQNCAMNCG